MPSTGGSGGRGCSSGCAVSSQGSALRPNTLLTPPSGGKRPTTSEPLSATQMLSLRSMRTACANDQAYRLCPISRRYLPEASNSSSSAAAAPYAGPVVFPRVNTKIWCLEFTAMPATSPKYMSVGSFRKSGTESKGISGTSDCASASMGSESARQASRCFILMGDPRGDGLLSYEFLCDRSGFWPSAPGMSIGPGLALRATRRRGFDRRAIGAAGHHAVLESRDVLEHAREQQAGDHEHHDQQQSN